MSTLSSGGAILSLKHIFGLKGDVKDNIHYIDETTVLFPAGYNIVLQNRDNGTQKFLPLASPSPLDAVSSGDISAMAMCHVHAGGKGALNAANNAASSSSSSNTDNNSSTAGPRTRRKILAVAERGEVGRASVSVFDVGGSVPKRITKSNISSPEISSTEIVCLALSPDAKYMLTQGGGPDYTLINWLVDKSKPLQCAKVSNQSGAVIHQVSYCPADPSVVCVTGNGILRFLHIEQNEFKSIPFSMGKREPQNYLCHCWIDDRILVGTDSGDILVFENAEFRGVLESSPSGGKSIDCIIPYSKGFVIGMDEGYIMLYDRDSSEIYKYSKSFQIDANFVKVKSLAISPSEDYCCCTLENNQAYVLSLNQTDLLKGGNSNSNANGVGSSTNSSGAPGQTTDDSNFESLSMPFHHMQITGLDVCIRKPLLVTCGMDRSVRIWNYNTRTVEVTRFFNEQPHSIAFHPSGLHILVGFTDNLRMMNILMDDCIPIRDFPIKGCKECQFSNGGQYFAAANGSVIQVFATYTCEMLGSFNVHKAKVRTITWIQDDSSILSSGMDGQIFITRIKSGEHVSIAKHKCNYTSVICGSDGKIYAVGSDKHLKVINESVLQSELNCGVILTQLTLQMLRPPLKDRFLFAGTDTGVIRVFPLPIEGKCYDQQIHTGAITRIRCSPDDNYLFSVGEDGCLAILQIEQKRDSTMNGRARIGAGGGSQSSNSSSSGVSSGHIGTGDHTLQWAEEILVNRNDLEEKMSILNDLQSKVQELMLHNETTLSLKDLAYKDKLRETTDKFHSELDSDKHRYQTLEDEKEQLEKNYSLKVDQLNSMQQNKILELHEHHIYKLVQEQDRYKELFERGKQERKVQESEIVKQEEECRAECMKLQREYEAKIAEARELKQSIVAERDQRRLEMQEDTVLTEKYADQEIDHVKLEADKKLTTERLTKLCLKDENAIFKRKFASLREDITENLDDLSRMKDKQQSLYDTIDTLEKDIKGHVKEIKERESTIEDKRHRIFELRKKNQELEKFKFVLDYKITELKRQIQPRKQEMKELSEQISEMEKELKTYRKESNDLQLDVTELNLKYNGMEKNIEKEVIKCQEVRARLSHFKTELHEVWQDLDDPKKLKDGIKRLFQRHVQNQSIAEITEQVTNASAREVAASSSSASSSSSTAAAASSGRHSKSAGSAAGTSLPSLIDDSSNGGPKSTVDDVHTDYHRQRHYLERSIDSHNLKCKKDIRVHQKEHTRIMSENIALTKEVNELRREKYHILVQQKSKEANQGSKKVGGAAGTTAGGRGGKLSKTIHEGYLSSMSSSLTGGDEDETEVQQEQIRALKKQLILLENEYQELLHGSGGNGGGGSHHHLIGGAASSSSHTQSHSSISASGNMSKSHSSSTLSARQLPLIGGNGSRSNQSSSHDLMSKLDHDREEEKSEYE